MVGEPVWLFICTRRIIDSLTVCIQVFAAPCDCICVSKQDILLHCGVFCMAMLRCHILFKLNELCGGICIKLKDGVTDENNKVQ